MRVFRSREPDEPSAHIFRAIRWRLTLWYSGILAAVLILLGVVLYFALRQTLLGPVDSTLRDQVTSVLSQPRPDVAAIWPVSEGCDYSPSTGAPPAPPGRQAPRTDRPSLIACYDANGKLLGVSYIASFYPQFVDTSLAARALHSTSGGASDIIDIGGNEGQIERYAARVYDSQTGQIVGVIEVATQVDVQLHALHLLLELLVLLGFLALLVAFGGGLFLANRALLPVRLAYSRQRDFIADASHELRTPLTMLRADAEVLLRSSDRLPPDDVALLEDMVSETTHMTSLANSMLDLARLDANGHHLERDVIDLAAIADEVTRRLGPLASQHNITVRTDAPAPVLVVGDRILLEQAILVLCDNAVKYNRPGGEVTVTARGEDEWATIEVRDTGIGIAPEHLPRLGERFYRVDKARSREAGGAGLGLSIVQTIAARHGGAFRLTSEPGRGTTATLRLPAVRGATVS